MTPGPAHRIIDANANRAREALRVMEDAARFVLDDAALCARLKSIRHGLAEALDAFSRRCVDGPSPSSIAWRDTPGDVGTAISAPSEMSRAGVRGVVIAAGKRLSEALRSIEEFAKIVDGEGAADGSGGFDVAARASELRSQNAAAGFEALRYEGYEAERLLGMAMGAGSTDVLGGGWKLCVIISESLCTHHSWLDVARMAIEGGADCIQLREKTLEGGELLRRARMLVELAAGGALERGARRGNSHHRSETGATRAGAGCTRAAVIINDRPDIAVLAGADGVHLGQGDLPVQEARKIVGFDMLIGVSTESIEQARAAQSAGADYCGVGPMFATATKSKPRLAGPGYLREYLAVEPRLPACLAIGGIGPEQMKELVLAAGARGLGDGWGVAVSSAVCGAERPDAACATMLKAIDVN